MTKTTENVRAQHCCAQRQEKISTLSGRSNAAPLQYRKSSFAPAFLFLPKERREALSLLYAVCRVLDDAVDTPTEAPAAFLEAWKRAIIEQNSSFVEKYGHAPLARDFLGVMAKYGIPTFALVDLIERGVSVDLTPRRFQTPLDTESYCYGVAGTVGLACLPIFGVPVEEARDYAIRLGITVQWINTIRDVGVDAKMGRIYLPLDHLDQFGYTEKRLFRSENSAEFQKLMSYEAQVARMHFKRAEELLPKKWEKELLPARIMGRIYMDLLGKIERKRFPVFGKKVRLTLWGKGFAALKELKKA